MSNQIPKPRGAKQSSLRRLIRSLKSQKRLIIAAISCSTLNKFFDLAPPVLIGLAVDVVARENNSWLAGLGFSTVPTQLTLLALVSFFIWSAESLFEYLYGLLWRNLAQSTQHNLRLRAYEHIQKLEMEFFESDSTGRLLTILNDDINQLERFLDHGANQILQLIVTVFLVGGAMAALAPKVAFLAFIPIPIILWGSINFQKLLAPRYKEVREKAGDLAALISNNLGGMLTIKSFTTESWELQRLSKESEDYKTSNKQAIRLSAAFIPLIRFAILFAFLAILVIGGLQTWKGEMAIGTYSFLVFITQRLLWPLTTLGNTLDEYQRSMASANRVLSLIDRPIRIYSGKRRLNQENVDGSIEFQNVSFKYIDREILFENFNLCIPKGQTLGVVGSTGCGKSTLVKLLLRLYPISSGKILVDGIPIDTINLTDLRRSIALVSQEVFLFHGTIAENIAYGNNNASLTDIKKAAELAEASEFINILPKKYHTLVGERGQRLSGGQRQRIALARAILKDSPILILDEATASVDNETEAAIQRSIAKITANRTTIVIAHRLSTVRHADHIIVLENGKLLEQGSHDLLLKEKNAYFDLWRVQAGLASKKSND
ncbi:ABC transporter ATP-binding protein [Prochlorococcus sp. MIT 1300]|uniref:ABC transporter ATP-binding protein n=1 Tax=Prochlorococcus sp. MIT 1300 TaxID=3096218 RepID=UPI002A761849|nr:ABC transporter ATP-binding protein [Prochlorococcus sp. MIT 1300]